MNNFKEFKTSYAEVPRVSVNANHVISVSENLDVDNNCYTTIITTNGIWRVLGSYEDVLNILSQSK